MARIYAIALDSVARDDGRHIVYLATPGGLAPARPYLLTTSRRQAVAFDGVPIPGARTLADARRRAPEALRARR